MQIHSETVTSKIDGVLHKITTIKDRDGQILKQKIDKIKADLTIQDVMQILVGASILAIPSALTEEVWDMGKSVPWINILAMLFIEYLIIGMFIYFKSYSENIKTYRVAFVKRILVIMLFSGLIIGLFLALVGQLPLFDDTGVAVKRIIIGMLPASMSATVMDSLK